MELTIVEMAIIQMKQAVVSLNMDMFCNCKKNIEELFSLLNLMKGDKLLMVVKWKKKKKNF